MRLRFTRRTWMYFLVSFVSLVVIGIGYYLSSPKKMICMLLFVWSSMLLVDNLRQRNRALAVVFAIIVLASMASLLFVSDWSATSSRRAIVWIQVSGDQIENIPSITKVHVSNDESISEFDIDNPLFRDRGICYTDTVISYVWHYRLLGGTGTAYLDDTSIFIESNVGRDEYPLKAVAKTVIGEDTQATNSPLLIYVTIPVR